MSALDRVWGRAKHPKEGGRDLVRQAGHGRDLLKMPQRRAAIHRPQNTRQIMGVDRALRRDHQRLRPRLRADQIHVVAVMVPVPSLYLATLNSQIPCFDLLQLGPRRPQPRLLQGIHNGRVIGVVRGMSDKELHY